MRLNKWILLTLCLLIGNGIWAQGKVTGKVFDKQANTGIEYASVTLLKTTDSSLVNGAATSSNGSFSIDKVPFGKYILRVSFMGYGTYYHTSLITLSASSPSVNVGKVLLSQSSQMLRSAQVTAERTMMEYQLDKRVVNVDKNIVASGGTATDVLENVPSVAVDNDGNVTLRGSSNVKVLINGRPYELMGNDLETLLEQIPASSVENVEVITNPSAKYDPEGMSGIINLKLKDKSVGALGWNGVASLNVGTPMAFIGKNYPSDFLPSIIPTSMATLNLNYTTNKWNFTFSADGGTRARGNVGQSNVQRISNGVTRSHDSIDNYGVFGGSMGSVKMGAEYQINEKNSVLLSYQLRGGNRGRKSFMTSYDLLHNQDDLLNCANYQQSDTNFNKNINHTVNFNYTHKFDQQDRLLTFDATFSHRNAWGEGWQEQLYAMDAVNLNNYYLRESGTDNFHNSFNFQLNYTHPLANGWKFESGYEGKMTFANQDSRYYRTQYDSLGSRYTFLDELSSTHYEHQQQIHAIYATLGGKLTDKLSAQAGLRGEYSLVDGHDLNHPSLAPVHKDYYKVYPTMHLSYEIDKSQSVQLSYSRRVRRPHMWDLNPYMEVRSGQELHFGNPNLAPEFTNSVELSYNLGFDKVNIFTSAYYRQTDSMMTRYGYVWGASSAAYFSPWMPYNPDYDGYWASTWQNLNKGVNYGLEFIVDWQVTQWWKMNVSFNLYENRIQGTDLLGSSDTSIFRASGKFSSYMNLPKDWTIQISGQYRAPYFDLQTQMYASYWGDLAVKKDLWQKRATLNIRVGDFLCTGGFGHYTNIPQLIRESHSKRLSPTITVGFSYKINKGLSQKKLDDSMYDEGGEGDF